jgi:5-formyltetrahydrofolate cyclo-ligase
LLGIFHLYQAQIYIAMIEHKCLVHDGKISAMDDKEVAGQKLQLRSKLKANRATREYNTDDASNLNIHLAELCLANGSSRIACYLPFDNEPDTELFIDWALENEIEVLLPVSNSDGSLTWVRFDGTTKEGIFGFQEAAGQIEEPSNIDLAIIPALAVDQHGMRLGKGKGFYDRALPKFDPLPPLVAVVFEDEIVESLPSEDHDHPVDAVVTPSGIQHFSQRLK